MPPSARNLPAEQSWQPLWPGWSAYCPPEHTAHTPSPSEALVPTPQSTGTEVPSQDLPSGHSLQVVRVDGLDPPLVYLVAAHVWHADWPPELYESSWPHSEQLVAPAKEYWPAGQAATVESK